MTQPLALVLYEKLLPGTQLVNRLQDLGYRVLVVVGADSLQSIAEQEKPLLVLADLTSTKSKVSDAIAKLRQTPATSHLPVLAFVEERETALRTAAENAGAALVVSDHAILTHLEQFLERALRLD